MAQRVGKPTRIEISRHRDAMVYGPCLLADGVVVSAATPSLRPNANSGDAIIKFDRALAGRVWEVSTERWELESVVDDLVLRLGPRGASVMRGSDGSTAWQVDSVQAGVVPEGIAVAHTDGEIRLHDAVTGAVQRAVPAPWPGRSYLRVHTRGLLLFPWVEDTDRLAFMPYDEPRMRWEIPYLSGVSAMVRAANDVEVDRYVNLLRAPDWIVLRARRQGWPASVDTRTPDYLIRVDDRDGSLLWCSEAVSADCFALTVAGHRCIRAARGRSRGVGPGDGRGPASRDAGHPAGCVPPRSGRGVSKSRGLSVPIGPHRRVRHRRRVHSRGEGRSSALSGD